MIVMTVIMIFSWLTLNIDDDGGDDIGDGDDGLQLGHLLVLICGHCYELALLDNVTINNQFAIGKVGLVD